MKLGCTKTRILEHGNRLTDPFYVHFLRFPCSRYRVSVTYQEIEK